ncbi:AAA family ATPase [Candidatus Woesearchaeota archaeon]|nr:AAA family ATPase [Candidatus Woesearchaeota archaeon]
MRTPDIPKRLPDIVIVTGTPGTGKTTIAKKLARKHNLDYIDVNDIVKEHKLSEGYDRKRKTRIVDEKKLAKILESIIKQARKERRRLIIDSHMSHCIDPKLVDLCIVTRTSLRKLANRLKRKGYHKAKIEENLECEIMDIILEEAKHAGHKVKVVET